MVVNPFREPALERYWVPQRADDRALFGTELMDDFFPVRPGGDIALHLRRAQGARRARRLGRDVRRTRAPRGRRAARPPAPRSTGRRSSAESGCPERGDASACRARTGRRSAAVIVYSMGLTQYTFGVENVKMVVNLALARGMIGRPEHRHRPHPRALGRAGHRGVRRRRRQAAGRGRHHRRKSARASRRSGAIRFRIARAARRAPARPTPARAGLDVLYLVGGNHLETMPDPAPRAARARERAAFVSIRTSCSTPPTLLDARRGRARAARRDPLRAALGRHVDLDRAAHPLHARDSAARASPRPSPNGRSLRSSGGACARRARPLRPTATRPRSATRWRA